MTKVCNKCKEEKSLDEFYKCKTTKDKRRGDCIQCTLITSKETYRINPARKLATGKLWREAHPERMKTLCSNWYQANATEQGIKSKLRYESNKLLISEAAKIRYVRNKPNILSRQKEYKNKLYATDIEFNIGHKLRSRIRDALKYNFSGKAKKSGKSIDLLGCTPEFYKTYLESKFIDGMTWELFMEGEIVIDHHPRPVCSFDLTDPEQQKQCFHYTNTRPLWKLANLQKIGQDRKQSIRNKINLELTSL